MQSAKASPPNDGMMSIQEVAKKLSVTGETVRRYIRDGKLKARKLRTVGLKEAWFVHPNDLAVFG